MTNVPLAEGLVDLREATEDEDIMSRDNHLTPHVLLRSMNEMM